jgi:sn-glycerol 3-phosphate transport system permease protein
MATDSRSQFSTYLGELLPVDTQVAIHTVLLGLVALIGFPLVMAAIFSTQSLGQIYNYQYVFPGTSTIENYATIFVQYNFGRLLLNTFIMATVVTVGSIAVSLLLALALVFYDFRVRRFVFAVIIFTLMVPLPVRIVPLYELIVQLNWHDSMVGLTMPFLASATSVFLLRQHFKTISVSLVESARMDGVGPLRLLWRVLIPMSKGMLAGLVVIIFIASWNAYLWPLIVINSEQKEVIQIGVRGLKGASQSGMTQWQVLMAGSIVAMIPPLVLLIVMRKPLLETMRLQVK